MYKKTLIKRVLSIRRRTRTSKVYFHRSLPRGYFSTIVSLLRVYQFRHSYICVFNKKTLRLQVLYRHLRSIFPPSATSRVSNLSTASLSGSCLSTTLPFLVRGLSHVHRNYSTFNSTAILRTFDYSFKACLQIHLLHQTLSTCGTFVILLP